MSCCSPAADLGHLNGGPRMHRQASRYEQFPAIPFDDHWRQRQWPSRRIRRAPRWCSVDLRDGNQALVNPMDVTKKMEYLKRLVDIGFKEIELGFPAASQIDFDFVRRVIEEKRVPEDVWISVLVQARRHLVERTVEALRGSSRAIIHLYNSTSTLQRDVVFKAGRDAIKHLAVEGTKTIRSLVDEHLCPFGTRVRFEYSPESFTGTELDFALEVCEAVKSVWKPTEEDPIILNLPSTVEMAGPNVYADQIEWMQCHLTERDKVLLSLHTHNDRGCAVAATELALQAGADRVEGCLFGNGERTGNACLVTLGINLLTQGVDPELDFSDLGGIVEMFERCCEMRVPERHPWAGILVYTAFSGSHQDAIKKGLEAAEESGSDLWAVPYLPIDPRDVGRSYEALVRINAQSGKAGIAYVLKAETGIPLPRNLQIEFSKLVQAVCDRTAQEVLPSQVSEIFRSTYLEATRPIRLASYSQTAATLPSGSTGVRLSASLTISEIKEKTQEKVDVEGLGSGPIAAFINAINRHPRIREALGLNCGDDLEVIEYQQKSLVKGSDAAAVCFVELRALHSSTSPQQCRENGRTKWGAARHHNTTTASLEALCSAANRWSALSRCEENGMRSEDSTMTNDSKTANGCMVQPVVAVGGE